MAISDYSTTPASNTSLSGIDITGTTGKVKDGDNAIRQLMADIKAGVPYLSGTNYLMESTDAGATAGGQQQQGWQGAVAGGVAGAAVPWALGAAALSRPGRALLANQLLAAMPRGTVAPAVPALLADKR